MTVTINERGTNNTSRLITMPDPELIAVPLIAKAVVRVREVHAQLRDARRARDAAQADVTRAENELETEAAAGVIESGKMPKGLRKAVKAAEEKLTDAKDEVKATAAAFDHAYSQLLAAIEANAPAWRAAALKDAERAVNLITAARKSLEEADRAASDAFGVLGMLTLGEERGGVRPVLEDTPQKLFVSMALPHLTDAIGATYTKLEGYKCG